MTQDTKETKTALVGSDNVQRIARLARINVNGQECERLAGELSSTLGWIDRLNEVDTDGVPPMTGVAQMTLSMRADEVTDGNRQDEVLRNAPERMETFFTVPKVIE